MTLYYGTVSTEEPFAQLAEIFPAVMELSCSLQYLNQPSVVSTLRYVLPAHTYNLFS
jgi:hypothetical protein